MDALASMLLDDRVMYAYEGAFSAAESGCLTRYSA